MIAFFVPLKTNIRYTELVNRVAIKLLFFACLILVSSKEVSAINPYATGSAVVSASVVGTSINPPILVSPSDNSTTNNPRQPLVWQRPSPLPSTPIHHYDVYLDGTVFAASVSDSITSQAYYFYDIRRNGDTFYLDFNTDLAQGYHTWKVVVYDNSGLNASSETRTFYIDSVAPFIKLEKVDHQTLNWDTSVYGSIPDINLRDLRVTTPNPLLTGKVEPFANMQIVLMCPQNIPNCTNQVYLGNYPTGNWQHRFYGLIKGAVYTVYISTTDAASNYTIFPEFYLAYGIVTPTPSAIITPIPSTAPGVSPTIVPEPSPEIVIPPVPFIPVPPVAPTPPMNPTLVPQSWLTTNLSLILFLLLVIGLPLHLLMTIYGAKIRFSNIPKFIYILLLPFIGKKEYQTVPFATLEMYDPEKLDNTWQNKIADVHGFYSLTTPLIKKIFVKITCTGRLWKNTIIDSNILSSTCLIPLLEDTKTRSNRLQLLSMRLRSLPLIIACLTSAYAMIIQPNYFYLVYLYLSLQYAFSEYLFPKLSK